MPAVPEIKPPAELFQDAPFATLIAPLAEPKSIALPLCVIVPSSTVRAPKVWLAARVTVYAPVASPPAANTALSPAVQVAGIPVPSEFVFQLAVVPVSHVPDGVGPPAPD